MRLSTFVNVAWWVILILLNVVMWTTHDVGLQMGILVGVGLCAVQIFYNLVRDIEQDEIFREDLRNLKLSVGSKPSSNPKRLENEHETS